MSTRAAAAREAAFLASSSKDNTLILQTAATTKRRRATIDKENVLSASLKANFLGETIHAEADMANASVNEASEGEGSSDLARNKKRKVTSSKRVNRRVVSGEPVKGGWGELPHNIGKIKGEPASGYAAINDLEDTDLSLDKTRQNRLTVISEDNANPATISFKKEEAENLKPKKSAMKGAARNTAKAARQATPKPTGKTDNEPVIEKLKKEVDVDFRVDTTDTENKETDDKKSMRKRPSRTKKVDRSGDVQQKVGELLKASDNPVKPSKKAKANPYGLTPGFSPFPDFLMPTPEACKQVEDALAEVHGKVEAPKEIPAPSLEVTGCGEVPSVLDALIRTRLSASTTSQNAKYAFIGLVERYGVLESGIGAGSVDWNKVRESDVLDIEKAIRKGGLAKTKSVSIKKILEMVHDQNEARREAFLKEKEGGEKCFLVGAEKMTQGQKDMEIDVAKKRILSLDFMHGLTADEAMNEFVKYPGIGVKTASCVILFCLQRPSFAVDTHVWRFCKWLKWVPEGATRDQTFSHCEVRIPNSMKYSLHQLFIRHGKTCGRCRAITGEGSEGWETTVCPLEHLVERTGKKKAPGPPMKPNAGSKKVVKAKKGKKFEEWEDDSDNEDEVDGETSTSGEE